MASVYETATSTYEITRLRTPDPQSEAAYGAVRGNFNLPQPLAVMRGPASIFGPAASGIGAGDSWVLNIPIPGADDIAWVIVQDGISMASPHGANVSKVMFAALGAASSGVTIAPPILQSGAANYHRVSGSSYDYAHIPDQTDRRFNMWLPVDPISTQGGTNSLLSVEASGAVAQDAIHLVMSGITWLGFDRNYWDTGAIWMPR